MYGTIHMYGIVHVTVYNTIYIYETMTWHWLMMWHWLMRCHDFIGLKFLCTVDWWRGSILVDQKSRVRYIHVHRIIFNQTASLFKLVDCSNRVVKPGHCSNRVLLTDDVAQSWASKLFLIRWPWFTQCIYKKEAFPPNLASLNPFLGSIFYVF